MTFLAEKSITYINYAYRVMHLPAGLFGVAIGSVAVADFSTRVAENTSDLLKERLQHALKLVSLLTIPIATMFLVLSVPICRVIYERGMFLSTDTISTAQALMLYAPGIFAAAGVRSVAACFYALKDTKTPAFVGLSTVVIGIAMNLLLMHRIGFKSFPLVTSTMSFLNFGVLFYLCLRKIGPLGGKKIVRTILLSLLFSVISGFVSYGLFKIIYKYFALAELWGSLATLAIAGIIGLTLFYLLAKIFSLTKDKQ